jgi:hypothetical protein
LFTVADNEEEETESESENPYPAGTQAAGAWDARHRTPFRGGMFGDSLD